MTNSVLKAGNNKTINMDGHLLRFKKDAKFCFIDFETYNLCLSLIFNRPWQLAILNLVGDKTVSSHDIYFKWPQEDGIKISEEAAKINHYSQQTIDEKGISVEEAFIKMDENLQAADYIIAHNLLGFDIYLIRGLYEMFKKDWRFVLEKSIDTRAIMQGIKTNVQYDGKEKFINYQYKLSNCFVKGVKTNLKVCAKENGIDFDESKLHNALYDLEVNAQLWNKIKFQINV